MTPVFVVIGATVLIIVLVLVSSNSGGGDGGSNDTTGGSKAQQPAAQPAAAPGNLAMSSAKGGSTPTTPAPPLSKETLDQVNAMLAEAKALFDDGYKMRQLDQAVPEANAKLSEAAEKIEAIKKLIDAPLRWQESADMEDWAQPAEYMTLAGLYGKVSTLENKVRKMGAKR